MAHQASVYIRLPWYFQTTENISIPPEMPVHHRLLLSSQLYSWLERSNYDIKYRLAQGQ